MKKISLLSLVALVAIGCSEAPSAPGTDAAVLATQHSSNLSAFRPPPPALIEGTVSAEYTSFTGTYFLNGPGNNGYISFANNQPTGTSLSSPSARISFHQGEVSGKGTLTLTSTSNANNTLVIDLSSGISGANFFGACTGSCGSFDATGTPYSGKIAGEGSVTVKVNLNTNRVVIGDVGF